MPLSRFGGGIFYAVLKNQGKKIIAIDRQSVQNESVNGM